MEKTVYELIEQYVEETAPEGTSPEEKEKMVRTQVVMFIRA